MPQTPHQLDPATRVIHGSGVKRQLGHPFLDGPTFASTYHLSGDPQGVEHQYGRFSNPTWTALESAIGELEGGVTRVFPSGVAAIVATLASLAAPGAKFVLPSDGYFATRGFAERYLKLWGCELLHVPTVDLPTADFSDVTLVLVETPSNPGLDVCDITQVCQAAHAASALVAVDDTTATVLTQTPLSLGADISIASDTKLLNGHSDVLFGHVAATQPEIIEQITEWRTLSGSIPGPMESWLVHRALATLELRLERQCVNAMRLAQLLQDHPVVKQLRYPGLESDPAHEIASRQMRKFGYLIGFELATAPMASAFLADVDLLYEATSFGGVHTMAERRARWEGDAVSPGFIRLSVGCEAIEDLLLAIGGALDRLACGAAG